MHHFCLVLMTGLHGAMSIVFFTRAHCNGISQRTSKIAGLVARDRRGGETREIQHK